MAFASSLCPTGNREPKESDSKEYEGEGKTAIVSVHRISIKWPELYPAVPSSWRKGPLRNFGNILISIQPYVELTRHEDVYMYGAGGDFRPR